MEVADLAASFLANVIDILLHPIEIIERCFVGGRDDGDIAGTIGAGLGVHGKEHLFIGRADQSSVEVGQGGNRCAIDGNDVIAGSDIETHGRKRGAGVLVPIFTGQDSIDAVGMRSWVAGQLGAE